MLQAIFSFCRSDAIVKFKSLKKLCTYTVCQCLDLILAKYPNKTISTIKQLMERLHMSILMHPEIYALICMYNTSVYRDSATSLVGQVLPYHCTI